MANTKKERVTLSKLRLRNAIRKSGIKGVVKLRKDGRVIISLNAFKQAIKNEYQRADGWQEYAGVSNGPVNDALQGRPVTLQTADNIAKFLGVDREYLTGEQLRPTKEETEKEIRRRDDIQAQRRIRQAVRLASVYGWRIVTTEDSGTFSVYDPEGDLICEGRDEKDLYPFLEAVEHLTQLGEDITYQFLGSLYTNNHADQ